MKDGASHSLGDKVDINRSERSFFGRARSSFKHVEHCTAQSWSYICRGAKTLFTSYLLAWIQTIQVINSRSGSLGFQINFSLNFSNRQTELTSVLTKNSLTYSSHFIFYVVRIRIKQRLTQSYHNFSVIFSSVRRKTKYLWKKAQLTNFWYTFILSR